MLNLLCFFTDNYMLCYQKFVLSFSYFFLFLSELLYMLTVTFHMTGFIGETDVKRRLLFIIKRL